MGHLAASPYVVIGAGMHGLSTAYHLALELERRGLGAGGDAAGSLSGCRGHATVCPIVTLYCL